MTVKAEGIEPDVWEMNNWVAEVRSAVERSNSSEVRRILTRIWEDGHRTGFFE